MSKATLFILMPLLVCPLPGQPQNGSAQRIGKESELNPAFYGTWKENPAKRKLGFATLTYEQEGDTITSKTGSHRFTFKLDGKDYPTDVPGQTITWKKLDNHTYEVTGKMSGKELYTSKREISRE